MTAGTRSMCLEPQPPVPRLLPGDRLMCLETHEAVSAGVEGRA
jgi:hypothetical protein